MFDFPASGPMNRSSTKQHVRGEAMANSQNIKRFNIWQQLQSVSVAHMNNSDPDLQTSFKESVKTCKNLDRHWLLGS